jgi:hypothetical protein
MTRLKTLAICLVAVFAIGVAAAATASAAAPEFGRCVKKAKAEGSGYSNAGCTTKAETGAKFEWQAGSTTTFTSEAREVETGKAKKCLLWWSEIKAGNLKHAGELLTEWKLTEAECEQVVKAHACWDEIRKGEPKEAEELGYTRSECEEAYKEWQEEDLKEPVILETTNGSRVECLGLTASGEYSGTNTVSDLRTTFTGCELKLEKAEKVGTSCHSTGASEGEIVVNPLEGELGLITKQAEAVKDTAGIALFAASGPIAEFECGAYSIVVTGSVIHQVTVNKMLLEENEKFDQSKGNQSVENFYGGEQDVLSSTIDGFFKFKSGEALLTRLVNAQEVEVNTVA